MSFSDIKGHASIVHFFKRELATGRIASSYLFIGQEGVGKMLFVRTLAKALNCLSLTDDACDSCASCVKIAGGNHPDVFFIEPADDKESIGIEAIRELQERVSLRPYEGRRKIFVINESERMTLDAQSCLLKTLEEPPADSVLILVTAHPEEHLGTVISRCRPVKFNPLDLDLKIKLALQRGYTEEEALFLARLANSGVRDADSAESGADDRAGREDAIVFKNKILKEFNTGESLLNDKSFIVSGSRDEMRYALAVIECWFRDLLVLKAAGDAALAINRDRVDELAAVGAKVSFEDVEEALKDVGEAQVRLDGNVGAKIVFGDLKMKVARHNIF